MVHGCLCRAEGRRCLRGAELGRWEIGATSGNDPRVLLRRGAGFLTRDWKVPRTRRQECLRHETGGGDGALAWGAGSDCKHVRVSPPKRRGFRKCGIPAAVQDVVGVTPPPLFRTLCLQRTEMRPSCDIPASPALLSDPVRQLIGDDDGYVLELVCHADRTDDLLLAFPHRLVSCRAQRFVRREGLIPQSMAHLRVPSF